VAPKRDFTKGGKRRPNLEVKLHLPTFREAMGRKEGDSDFFGLSETKILCRGSQL